MGYEIIHSLNIFIDISTKKLHKVLHDFHVINKCQHVKKNKYYNSGNLRVTLSKNIKRNGG